MIDHQIKDRRRFDVREQENDRHLGEDEYAMMSDSDYSSLSYYAAGGLDLEGGHGFKAEQDLEDLQMPRQHTERLLAISEWSAENYSDHYRSPQMIIDDIKSDGNVQNRLKGRERLLPALLQLPVCEIRGCKSVAVAGTCNFKVSCLVRGCGKLLCRIHLTGNDPKANYARLHEDQVCVECENRARRGRVCSIALIIVASMVIAALLIVFFDTDDLT